jgi:hypothetical protein
MGQSMAMSSFLIVLFIFILSGVFVLRPFFDRNGSGSTATAGRYDALLAEKERLYSIIEDLDQSLDLGKISSQDHSRSRAELLNQAAWVLAELDKIGGKKKKASGKTASSLKTDDELEKMIQARRKSLSSNTWESCPQCGEPVGPKDQFCSHCGESL